MSKKILTSFVLIIALVCTIIGTSAVVMAEPDAGADVKEKPQSEVKIMHITDIHYIPAYYCYTGDKKENAFATKIKGDPKLMLESYALLEETVNMIKNAEDVPDYVFLTGDITSNGEKQSLIDVANAMRSLQNEMRKKNPNFQILVVPGNHDVFNNRHSSYYNIRGEQEGTKIPASIASRTEFVKIFSSLGFPDLSDAEAETFYKNIDKMSYENDMWTVGDRHLPYKTTGDVAFVNSTTREGLAFDYYYKDAMAKETDPIKAAQILDGLGGLTYLMKDDILKTAVFGFDSTLSIKNDQRTEGEYTRENIEWFSEKAPTLDGYTMFGLGHHNVVPHFTVQEQYLQAFVTYGWEEVAEAFASRGLNYFFTGHLHANDVENYVSFNNNTMYDIETGATISYGSAIRSANIKTYANGNQDLVTKTIEVDKADFSYLVENNLMPEGYDDCFKDKANNIIDVQKYIEKKLFKPYLENMIDSFISTEKIYAKIDAMKPIKKKLIGKEIVIDLKEIVYELLDQINTKTLKNYTYKGDIASLKKPENKVIGYVHELLSGAIKSEVTKDKSFEDLVIFAYGCHLMGSEVASEEELPEWFKNAINEFRNGSNMDMVIDELIYSKNGIYDLLDKVTKTSFDLTGCTNSIDSLKTAIKLLGVDLNLSNIVLNTDVQGVLMNDKVKAIVGDLSAFLQGDTLMESVDIILDDYLNDKMKKGIGSVLSNIAISFSVDSTSYDGAFNGDAYIHKVNKDDAYSFMGRGKAVVTPTIKNGRLPSMLTMTFGNDPTSTRNFVWFTSQFAPTGKLQYREAKANAWTTVDANSNIMPYSYPMTDFGLFSSKIDKNIRRNNVRLTSLKAGTTYEYRVGYINSDKEIWTPIGLFKTAKAEKGDFEVAILSDMQGMSREHYVEVNKMLTSSKDLFANGPDFAISLGDIVSDGKNSDQWNYALDIPADYFRNTTQLVLSGNRDAKLYESGKVKERKRAVNVDIKSMKYNPVNFHYDMNVASMDELNYYSIDYMGIHFTVIDTNDTDDLGELDSTQLNWLKNDLKNTKLTHKVVLMHKGLYSRGMHAADKEIKAMRAQLAPIFYENKVELVLSGHDNLYSETERINASGVADANGVKYVNIAGMRDKDYSVDTANMPVKHAAADKSNNKPLDMSMGVLKFDSASDKLTYQGYATSNDKLVKVEEYVPTIHNNPKAGKIAWIITGVILGVGVIATIVSIVISKNKKNKKSEN